MVRHHVVYVVYVVVTVTRDVACATSATQKSMKTSNRNLKHTHPLKILSAQATGTGPVVWMNDVMEQSKNSQSS